MSRPIASSRHGIRAGGGKERARRAHAHRPRDQDIALIGIVLLALAIAVLVGGSGIPFRLPIAGGFGVGALLFFALAHTPDRRL